MDYETVKTLKNFCKSQLLCINIRPTTLSSSDSPTLHKKEEKSEAEDEQENCTETRHVVEKVDTRDTVLAAEAVLYSVN